MDKIVENKLEGITGLAQSTGIKGSSIKKGKYLLYSESGSLIVNSTLELQKEEKENKLNLDFDFNNIKDITEYILNEYLITFQSDTRYGDNTVKVYDISKKTIENIRDTLSYKHGSIGANGPIKEELVITNLIKLD